MWRHQLLLEQLVLVQLVFMTVILAGLSFVLDWGHKTDCNVLVDSVLVHSLLLKTVHALHRLRVRVHHYSYWERQPALDIVGNRKISDWHALPANGA